MKPTFFPTPNDFRKWLEANHERHPELLVGFYKKGTGRPSITWPESVEQALCFGWIDGVRRSVDEHSYTIRFTPRKADSNWSAINIRTVNRLIEQGLMHRAGVTAFERRSEKRSVIYSYEQKKDHKLPPVFEKKLKANKEAWDFFQSRAPHYRRTAAYWVISAVKEETREKRLATLIADSAAGRLIGPLRPRKPR